MPTTADGSRETRKLEFGAMDRAELLEAADRNVAVVLRHFAANAEGAVMSEGSAALLVAAAVPYPGAFHNAALRLDPSSNAETVLDEMLRFSAEHDRDVILWASTHRDADLETAAERAGLQFRSTTVGMAIDAPPDKPAVAGRVDLVRVTDAADAAQFAAVHEQLFRESGRSPDAVAHFASPRALLAPNAAAFIARLEGRPVACAMAVTSGQEAGVYWVATRADARRRGFGELVARAATRAGFEQGARVVVLQSTEQGVPLYRRLGFTPFTAYARYLANPCQPPSK
ncbi:GNAT family N-acetyltransferase [Kribbella sp. NPDC049584]|uniref:GNAT family N-acetyltransferase n=1 Tax=Kribbella sp. NPDC049584 TaxID=3154833 RepID=UPI00342DCD75